jgi:hypothetical protein
MSERTNDPRSEFTGETILPPGPTSSIRSVPSTARVVEFIHEGEIYLFCPYCCESVRFSKTNPSWVKKVLTTTFESLHEGCWEGVGVE